MNNNSVAVIIPLYKPEPWLTHIRRFLTENAEITFLLILTGSLDDLSLSQLVFENTQIIYIPQAEFNHGATRELARKTLNTDFVVFLTQDAIATSADLVEKLVTPLLADSQIAACYGRQIPHDNADILEAFPREFNYGDELQIRSIEDVKKYGVYTFFCSNSCAVWCNSALDKVGGFKTVLTNEDYFAAAALLQANYKVAYQPLAVVKHSHRYTLCQEFQRYFDTGYVRAQNPVIQQLVGQAEGRGLGFFSALLKQLWPHQAYLIPYAVLQSAVKWLGYRVGFYGRFLPVWIKRRLSQQAYYW
jgi:rhamnosyltransferase